MSAMSESRCPLGCFGVTACGVLEAGHRDHPVPVLLGQQRHADDGTIDPGVGRDDEHVRGVERVQREQLLDHAGVALHRRPGELVGMPGPVQRQVTKGDVLVGMSPPARPAISMANAWEWPVPNAWTTPPSLMQVVIDLDGRVEASRPRRRPRSRRAGWSPRRGDSRCAQASEPSRCIGSVSSGSSAMTAASSSLVAVSSNPLAESWGRARFRVVGPWFAASGFSWPARFP